MRRTFSLFALLVASTLAFSAEPKIVPLPETRAASASSDVAALRIGKFRWLTIVNYEGPITWDWSGKTDAIGKMVVKPGDRFIGTKEDTSEIDVHEAPTSKTEVLVVWGKTVGDIVVSAWGVTDGKDGKPVVPIKLATVTVSVIGQQPAPPGPSPTPGPNPSVAPIAGDGLKVLIKFETEALGDSRSRTARIIYSKDLRDFLESNCAKDTDGKTSAFRMYDQNVSMDGETQIWKDAMARPHNSVPWLVISNPKVGGYEGELPDTVEKVIELIKKFK